MDPKTSLLDLAVEAARVEALILNDAQANDGEIHPDLDRFLSEIETSLETKVDQYKFVIDRLEDSEFWLRGKAEEFERAAKQIQLSITKIRGRIKQAMTVRGLTEMRGTNWRFKLSPSAPKLEIRVEDLPDHLKTMKEVYSAKTEEIREALKRGETVPGVLVSQGATLRSYINKRD